MNLLKRASVQQAYLKGGILGFPASGKTQTAARLVIGLVKKYSLKKPVAMYDTEGGSDFLVELFEEAKVELVVVKARAFSTLMDVAAEAERECSALIVDSITHPWNELMLAAKQRKKRIRLTMPDIQQVKEEWAPWPAFFLNSKLHIVVCGRAGYEWDNEEDEDGHKNLIKTGTKMKVESDFGFEPSLLFEMQRVEHEVKGKKGWLHKATVLKDRFDVINGNIFTFSKQSGGKKWAAVFNAFEPHITRLAIGGTHAPIDMAVRSEDLFATPEGASNFAFRKQQKAIALEEIKDILIKFHPGTSEAAKKTKGDILEEEANTRTWAKLEDYELEEVQAIRNRIWQRLEGKPYGMSQELVDDEISFGEKA